MQHTDRAPVAVTVPVGCGGKLGPEHVPDVNEYVAARLRSSETSRNAWHAPRLVVAIPPHVASP
jgi:hypothetical protein